MNIVEKEFFYRIEENRGIIKNKKKFEPIVCDILSLGNNQWLEECTKHKHFGLSFIWEVVTTLDADNQHLLFNKIFSLEKVNISNARMLFSSIKLSL